MTTRPHLRDVCADEEGSILPLVAGYAVIAILVILVVAEITGLHLAQKRVDAVASAAALAAADGFDIRVDGTRPRVVINPGSRDELAQLVVDSSGDDVVLVAATSPDDASARVTVRALWYPLMLTVFLPGGIPLESTATSRTALR